MMMNACPSAVPGSLNELLGMIAFPDAALAAKAAERLDDLTKPQGSLGRLEEIASRLFVISGGSFPLQAAPAALFVAGGDHGVWNEKVSPHPQEVTHQMMLNICSGGAASSVLTRTADLDLIVIDAGHAGGNISGRGIATLGERTMTGNIACENAMPPDLCERLILRAAALVTEKAASGLRLAAIGEMGIANTTPATALFSAYLGLNPKDITGPGTGLTANGVKHKAEVIGRALAFHAPAIESGDPLRILSELGGFEIAVMTGIVLGAAAARIPVLIDGFIATSAYAAARALCPACAPYAFLCTASAEPGYKAVCAALGEKPLLDLGLRLGEGTGTAVAYPLFRAAAAVFNEMASYSDAGVTKEKDF